MNRAADPAPRIRHNQIRRALLPRRLLVAFWARKTSLPEYLSPAPAFDRPPTKPAKYLPSFVYRPPPGAIPVTATPRSGYTCGYTHHAANPLYIYLFS